MVKAQEDPRVTRVRNKIVVIHDDGHVSAVCKSCGVEVDLPLRRIDTGPGLYLAK